MVPESPYTVAISLGPFVLVLLCLIAVGFALLLPVGPRAPRAATAGERHAEHRRLEHARLARMLRRMKVSPEVYLQRLHPGEVRAQLDTCAACPHTFLCDQALAAGREPSDLSFCPNLAAIERFERAA